MLELTLARLVELPTAGLVVPDLDFVGWLALVQGGFNLGSGRVVDVEGLPDSRLPDYLGCSLLRGIFVGIPWKYGPTHYSGSM